MDLNHFDLWIECHCGLWCYIQHLHIQEIEISGKFKKEVTYEGPHNLYTKNEKTGNARIPNLVFSHFGGMFDTGIHVDSAEGCSTVIARQRAMA